MSVNFFRNNCKAKSSKTEFGICDDDDSRTPAYIDEFDNEKWIGIVENPNRKNIVFYAIDNCIKMLKDDGSDEKQCDGLLKKGNQIIFIELKNKRNNKWFKEGKEQIIATYKFFKQHHDISDYSFKAYICNKKRPYAHSGRAVSIQQFFDETGFTIQDKQKITIA